MIVLKSDFKEKFNKLRDKNDRKEWISGPAIVNAFYSPPANQICIQILFYFYKNLFSKALKFDSENRSLFDSPSNSLH